MSAVFIHLARYKRDANHREVFGRSRFFRVRKCSMVVLTTIEQDSNTVLYSIHSGLHRPGATDASTSGTGGRQAPPHNPCTLGPRASADVQDEAGRRREIHGDHPSR